MFFDKNIEGKYITLKSVTLDDAQFIVNLRNDENKNAFLHATSTDIELQKDWIKCQMEREGDFYFVMYDSDGEKIGLVSVYDINKNPGGAEFGRWISWGNVLQNIESIILLFDFAFENFDIDYIYTRTMVENKKVVNLWKRFGGNHIGKVYEMNLWLDKNIVTRDEYYKSLRQKNIKLLNYE